MICIYCNRQETDSGRCFQCSNRWINWNESERKRLRLYNRLYLLVLVTVGGLIVWLIAK